MRQVFTSARLENVESVAQLLNDAGIETRITNGRSYKGAIRGNFSYRGDAGRQQPAVWIVRSEDQPRARAMLREADLMDSSRNAPDSYLAMSFRGTPPEAQDEDRRRRRALRIKLGLLLVIVAVIALAYMARKPAAPAPAASAAATTQAPKIAAALPARGNAATPDALAVAVLRGELPRRADGVACIAIDGQDASPALLAALAPTPGTLLPMSRCGSVAIGAKAPAPLRLALGKYEATAAGIGTLILQRQRGPAAPPVTQWFDVRPDGDGWRVVQPL